jgi:hypothetical protein
LNGDGCPKVVVLAVAVGVGVGVGGGGGGVVTRAGAAGSAVPAGGRRGAVTVTVGIETLGPVCGAACGASGAACVPGGAGASDAGGPLVGGGSGDGACDQATPLKQSNASAELLRRSKRRVRIDMTIPQSLTGVTPSAPKIGASRRNAAARGIDAAVARARACRHQIDVRQWEVRAPQKARVGVRRSRTRRPFRLASGRKHPAVAMRVAQRAPMCPRDGSGYRLRSGRQFDLLRPRDRRARCVRRSTHPRRRR